MSIERENLKNHRKEIIASKLLEMYRRNYGYRQTASGRWRERDEFERDDNPDVISHNLASKNYLKRQKQKREARQRLIDKGIAPVKKRQSTNEEFIPESLNDLIASIRKNYYSSRKFSFREWCSVMEDILDTI